MSSEIKVDTISENTSANGVAIDSLGIKDGKITNLMNATLSAADLGTGVHIKTADSGASVNANRDELVLENSGHCGMTILSGTSSVGGIGFGDSDGNLQGLIQYSHANEQFEFNVNSSANPVNINSSGITLGGSGAANTLDDYEEGTWTPSATNLPVNTVHKAIYRKIGDIVFLYCDITLDSSPSDTAQATSLAGFPFTCNDDYFQCNSRVAGLNQVIEANIAGTGAVFRDKADGVVCTRSEFAGDRCQHIFIYTIA